MDCRTGNRKLKRPHEAPKRSAQDHQNTPSAVGAAGPAQQPAVVFQEAESPPKQQHQQMDQFSTLYPSPPARAALQPTGSYGVPDVGSVGTANERPVPLEVSPRPAPMNPARGDLPEAME